MSKYKIKTTHQINELIMLCNDGYTIRQIANHLNITTNCIMNTLHRLNIKTKYSSPKINDLQEVEICHLYTNKLSSPKIAKLFGVCKFTILKILEKHNVSRRDRSVCQMKYDLNIDYFKDIDSNEKAYWLGFISGDGCVYKNQLIINLAQKDKHHLELFAKCIDYNGPIKLIKAHKDSYGYKNKGRAYNFTISNMHFVNFIRQFGISENKTRDFSIPTNISHKFMSSYILGLIDADGSFRNNGKQVSLSLVGTVECLLGVQKILMVECNLNKTKLISHHTTQYIKYLEYSGNKQLYRITEYLYKNVNCLLYRKYDKVKHLKDKYMK